jgi:hypothetical protein
MRQRFRIKHAASIYGRLKAVLGTTGDSGGREKGKRVEKDDGLER